MELIDILESHLNFDVFPASPFEIHRIMHDFFFVIQFADESKDSIRLMINDLFRLRSPLSTFEHDLKIRVQIRCLMKPAFYLFCFELCLFKYASSGAKFTFVPVLVFPIVGNNPSSSSITGFPCSYLS